MYWINTGVSMPYLLYTALIYILIQQIVDGQNNIFIRIFSVLFVLGGWLKITIHGIFQYGYVERTGYFTGTPSEWNALYYNSITVCLALIMSFMITKINFETRPPIYRKQKEAVLTGTFTRIASCTIVAVYAFNWQFGFYRIGVARDLSLPFGLDAPASFMVYLAAPALLAVLANDSIANGKRITRKSLFLISITCILAGIVTYSRSTIPVIMLPILLGMYKKSTEMTGRRPALFLMVIFVALALFISLVSVSLQRISIYGASESISDQSIEIYMSESIGLFVDRWIGAESMMVAVSTDQSIGLLVKMISEDPSIGTSGIYQNLSLSQYFNISIDGMTFLTLPGVFAILAFSGNFLVVFVGVLVFVAIGVCAERLIARNFVANYPLQYFVSGYLAYIFSQIVFPRLLLPLLIQTLVFLILLKFILNRNSRIWTGPQNNSSKRSHPLDARSLCVASGR